MLRWPEGWGRGVNTKGEREKLPGGTNFNICTEGKRRKSSGVEKKEKKKIFYQVDKEEKRKKREIDIVMSKHENIKYVVKSGHGTFCCAQ